MASAPADDASGAPGSTGTDAGRAEGEAARADAGIEHWVQAASVPITEANRRTWKERFQAEKQRLIDGLGKAFPSMTVQLCESARSDEGILRVGPAGSAGDAELKRLLAKVRSLDGFKDAFIRKWRKP